MPNSVPLAELAQFFSSPENHIDTDFHHVSKEEFRAAKRKLSIEARRVADAVYIDHSSYDAIRSAQNEGWFNDREVSLRDLHALARGTSYAGDDLSMKRATIFQRLRETTNRLSRVEVTGGVVSNTTVKQAIQQADAARNSSVHDEILKFFVTANELMLTTAQVICIADATRTSSTHNEILLRFAQQNQDRLSPADFHDLAEATRSSSTHNEVLRLANGIEQTNCLSCPR